MSHHQSDPIQVEVTRGSLTESRHLVDAALVDGHGNLISEFGETAGLVFPRSAIKSFQAIPLVESGAAETFGFSAAQIALACSSHNGEAVHVDGANDMLKRAGMTCDDLECGCHVPMFAPEAERLFRANGHLSPLHNNCSGKHAGMLAFAEHAKLDTKGYIKPDHPVQRHVTAVLESLTGETYGQETCGIDGCSIPTYAVPLISLARAASRFATQQNMENARAAACRRILAACCDHPDMVAGTDRACTRMMQAVGRRASVKVGAEGVYIAMLPETGIGIALKARDGATRAAEVAIASLLKFVLCPDENFPDELNAVARQTLRNHNKTKVGEIRVSDLSEAAFRSVL